MRNKKLTIGIIILLLTFLGVMIYMSIQDKLFIIGIVLDTIFLLGYIVKLIKETIQEKREKEELHNWYASCGAIKVKEDKKEEEQ